jgi:hypothetical protein
VLCFKPKRNVWYQDMPSMPPAVCSLLGSYERRVAYGSSMGAYAALYFADDLMADHVIAVSPQYSPILADIPFEKRWHDVLRSVGISHRWHDRVVGAHTTILYDPMLTADRLHVDLLRPHLANLHELRLPFSSHPSIAPLQESRQLKPVLLALLDGKNVDLQSVRRIMRERSQHYARTLILHANTRNPVRALGLFNHIVRTTEKAPAWIRSFADVFATQLEYRGHPEFAKQARAIAQSALEIETA